MQPKDLLKKAEKIAPNLSLKNIHLWKSNCERDISFKPKKAEMNIQIDTKILDSTDKKFVPISCHFNIIGTDIEKNKKAIQLDFTFCVIYSIRNDLKANKADLEAFASTNAIFNVWPFAREHVQNIIVKMDLPAFVLPTITIGQLVNIVIKK
ncbi:MAG: hypothetical protein R6W88_08825 [Desulfobacterales bacterium]